MALISDKDRNVFKEAASTVLDNFTEPELGEIGTLASKLGAIIKAAQERQQDKLRNLR
jgi:hypothetical protein